MLYLNDSKQGRVWHIGSSSLSNLSIYTARCLEQGDWDSKVDTTEWFGVTCYACLWRMLGTEDAANLAFMDDLLKRSWIGMHLTPTFTKNWQITTYHDNKVVYETSWCNTPAEAFREAIPKIVEYLNAYGKNEG